MKIELALARELAEKIVNACDIAEKRGVKDIELNKDLDTMHIIVPGFEIKTIAIITKLESGNKTQSNFGAEEAHHALTGE